MAGELILTFYKTGNPLRVAKNNESFDVGAAMNRILSEVDTEVIYGEQVFNAMVLEAWKQGSAGSLQLPKDEFNDLIRKHGWEYDEHNHRWTKRKIERLLFAKA